MTQRNFFATAEDLLAVFDKVEQRTSVTYTLAGMFDLPILTSTRSGASIPSLRVPASDTSMGCPTYLLTQGTIDVNVRAVPQNGGGVRYAVDQLANPDSISLIHGGIHLDGMLISGRVGTVSASDSSRQLQSAFSRAIGTAFTRVNAYWVGPQAMTHLLNGWRLTFSAKAPPTHDLAAPAS